MSATFDRDILALPQIFEFMGRFFAAAVVDPKLRFAAELSVEEVFTNFVKYNAAGRDGIGIRLRLDRHKLSISLSDYDAPRFDIMADAPEPDTDLPLAQRTPGGLGLHLVKKMMDRVDYSHENGVGTVQLSKAVS
jgi:serine/threonine-protein kinase RsbW